MIRCNYCDLKSIRRDASKAGLKVTLLRDAKWGLGGTNVYVHRADVDIKALSGGEDGQREQYRRAWMWTIPDHCVCDD